MIKYKDFILRWDQHPLRNILGYDILENSESAYSKQYLTIQCLEEHSWGVKFYTQAGSSYNITNMQYSIDRGKTWNQYSEKDTLFQPDQEVMFKNISNAGPQIYVEAYGNKGEFKAQFNASGNPLSLIYGDNFKNVTDISDKAQCLRKLFYDEYIVNAENLSLPATILSTGCYSSMFESCTKLISAPILPASILVEFCYESMFRGCSSLNKVKMLATDTSANGCLYRFLQSTSRSGLLVVKANANWDFSLIPGSWTIVDENDNTIRAGQLV